MGKYRTAKIEQKVLEIDGIPTAEGLVRRKLARRTVNGIQISDEGHALLGQMLRAKARVNEAKGIEHGVNREFDLTYG